MNYKESKKLSVNILIYILYSAIVIINLCGVTTLPLAKWGGIYDIRVFFILLLSSISVCFRRHTRFQLVISTIMILIMILSIFLYKANVNYLWIILLAFGLSDQSPTKIIKISAVCTTVMLVVILCLALSGLIPDLTYIRDNTILRHSFGTAYPLIFSALLFYCIAGWLFISRKLNKLIFIIMIILSSIFIFKYLNARNDAISLLLLLLVFLFNNKYPIFEKKIIGLGNIFLILFSTITIFISKIIPSSSMLYVYLDSLFSGRLNMQYLLFQIYEPKLLGQYLYQMGNGVATGPVLNYFYIDSSYTKLFFSAGILFYLCIMFLYFKLIYSLNKVGLRKQAFILIIIGLNGLVEDSFINLSLNNFILLVLITKEHYLNDLELRVNNETISFNNNYSNI